MRFKSGFTSLKISHMERLFVMKRYNELSEDEKNRFSSGAIDSSKPTRVSKYFPDYVLKDKNGKVIEVG